METGDLLHGDGRNTRWQLRFRWTGVGEPTSRWSEAIRYDFRRGKCDRAPRCDASNFVNQHCGDGLYNIERHD